MPLGGTSIGWRIFVDRGRGDMSAMWAALGIWPGGGAVAGERSVLHTPGVAVDIVYGVGGGAVVGLLEMVVGGGSSWRWGEVRVGG
jgi:hypothetical protein